MVDVKHHPRSAPELIVITRAEAGIRSEGPAVRSASGAKTSSLNSLLKSSKATLRPLFDVSEDRAQSTMGPVLRASRMAGAIPDISTFYIVEGAPKNLSKLAADMLGEGTVEAAYVKPGGEPPEWYDAAVGVPPDAPMNFAPAPTSDFNARQGYLDAAPSGSTHGLGGRNPAEGVMASA